MGLLRMLVVFNAVYLGLAGGLLHLLERMDIDPWRPQTGGDVLGMVIVVVVSWMAATIITDSAVK